MKVTQSLFILVILLSIPVNSTNAIKSNHFINLNSDLYSCSESPDLSLSQSTLPYSKTGTIYENGDEYWDSNELNIIRYVIPAGETFEMELHTSSSAELWIFYGSISNTDDVEDALGDLVNSGSSSRLLEWDYTEYGLASFSFTTSSETDKNIAIFTYDSYNPSSMSYTIYTSIEVYTPPPPPAAPSSGTSSGSSGSSSYVGYLFLIGLGLFILYKIYKSNKRKKERKDEYEYNRGYTGFDQYSQTQYSQPTYQQPYTQSAVAGSHSPHIGKVCDQCNSEVSEDNLFCTTCGNRVS